MTTGSAQTVTAERTWRTTMKNALVITRREVRDSFRDWRIIAPIIILTFFFPFLAQFIAARFSNFISNYEGTEIIARRAIPFLLMIVGFFPISISLVIALETFVGEKERRSIEPLLSTPLTNTELYIGKMLSSMIPPLVASFGGMMVYLLTLLLGDLAWRPQPVLVVQIMLLTSVQALVMVTGAVVVSSQTTSTRAANLLASFIIIPMMLIINGESYIMFAAPDAESPYGIGSLWAIIAGMFVAVVLLLRVGNSIFNREELLGRSIDSINLIGGIKTIGRYIVAVDDDGTRAANALEWYRKALPYSLRKLRGAAIVTIGVFIVYFVIGYWVGTLPAFQLPIEISADTVAQSGNIDLYLGDDILPHEAVGLIIAQNTRVLLLAGVLSAFSFGVVAYVLVPVVFAVLGYLAAQLLQAGLGSVFWIAVLPHGIVEIPMIVIATAAMFRLGAIITKPPNGQGVGQAWIIAIGDTLKIALGVVAPLLVIAALLEVYLTIPLVTSYLESFGA